MVSNESAKETEITGKSDASKLTYSGLLNQGNTCYMNSLLQSLFMTFEFRQNILTWKYDEINHGSREDCIPFQLQKLFSRLQLRIRPGESTKDLTKSFQWNSGEVFQQHDIQELCRVLFEAIEISFANVEENFINNIFEGKTKGIVECLECNYKSERNDTFLDLSLPVINEFENIFNNSLEMALFNFLKPEKLDKDNKYFCDKCNKKVEALKYTTFSKLPKVLFFQLGRFGYDFNTNMRKKINDLVTFPNVLNMNKFLKDYDHRKSFYNDIKFKELTERTIKNEEELNFEIEESLKEGENVYDLYSIVIHSGSALGGHYYAYIKSFENNKWYCFNDSSVYEIKSTDIKKVFGGQSSYDSATGYCLLYRKYEKNMITNIPDNIIDPELKKILDEENIKILEEERIMKEKLNSVNLKFSINGLEKQIFITKTSTVKELKLKVLNEYGIKDEPINCRIRVLNQHGNLTETFPEEEKTVDDYNIYSYRIYTLEIRENENIPFEDFNPNIISIHVYFWNEINKDLSEKNMIFDIIKINRQLNLIFLKEKIYDFYKIDKSQEIYCFKRTEFGNSDLFTNENDSMKEIFLSSIFDGSMLFVEVKDENWKESNFKKKFDEKNQYITLSFNTPLKDELIKSGKISVGMYKFEFEQKVKKSITVKEVKNIISDTLKIDKQTFIIRKLSHHGQELKNYNEKIETIASTFSEKISIFVELGNPMKENELRIHAFLCSYDFSKFKIYPYKLTEIGTYVINTDQTFEELKIFMGKEIDEKLGIKSDLNSLLVREHILEKPTKIFDNEAQISQFNFGDGKKLIFHEYKKAVLRPLPKCIQVAVREWDPSNWTISEPLELIMEISTNFESLAIILNHHFPHIETSNISVYKIITDYNLYMDDFKKFNFTNLHENLASTTNSYPLYINNDGSMLLIKDDRKEYREPTEDEREIYCKPQIKENLSTALVLVPDVPKFNQNNDVGIVQRTINKLEGLKFDPTNRDPNRFNKNYKEKGLKITVKNNMTDEEKKNFEEGKKDDIKNSDHDVSKRNENENNTKINIQIQSKSEEDILNYDFNENNIDDVESLI